MYFGMTVSPDYLLAATVVATVAREYGGLDCLVDMSQMTVSQMTATSTAESHQQRLHWLSEQVLNWFGPAGGAPCGRPHSWTTRCSPHWRPGRSGPMARSRCRSARGARPGRRGRRRGGVATHPARPDAARSGRVYELTGPRTLDLVGVPRSSGRALGRPGDLRDVPLDHWLTRYYRRRA